MKNFPGAKQQLFQVGGTFLPGYNKKIVLHTTEGQNWPDYDGKAPHLTICWMGSRFEVRQHMPLTMAARALKNASGGVETNRGGAIQVEIIGTCDYRSKVSPYWPGASDEMLKELGFFIRQLAAGTGVNVDSRPSFITYPQSYGNKNRQRFSGTDWKRFNGVCGHQHVPENDHGDPGNLNVARALLLSSPVAKPVVETPKKEIEMFVGKVGSSAYRILSGGKYAATTKSVYDQLAKQGVPAIGLTPAEDAAFKGTFGE